MADTNQKAPTTAAVVATSPPPAPATTQPAPPEAKAVAPVKPEVPAEQKKPKEAESAAAAAPAPPAAAPSLLPPRKPAGEIVEEPAPYVAPSPSVSPPVPAKTQKTKAEPSSGGKAVPVLSSPTLAAVAEAIKAGKCKNIIVLTGAGISVSAGIPDFRSPKTGLFNNLQRFKLPEPEAVFDIEYFQRNPKPFYTVAKELYPGEYKATKAHFFIRVLHEQGLLLRNFTQNIDTLEDIAGVPADKVVCAHGSFATAHCFTCKKEYTKEWVKEKIFADQLPKCTVAKCPGMVKPDIVFYGEDLPAKFYKQAEEDFPKCDMLIIMGTSLAVYPFAALLDQVGPTVPRLLINREKVTGRSMRFDSLSNTRDVFLEADCDDGVDKLATLMGLKDELDSLLAIKGKTLEKKSTKGK